MKRMASVPTLGFLFSPFLHLLPSQHGSGAACRYALFGVGFGSWLGKAFGPAASTKGAFHHTACHFCSYQFPLSLYRHRAWRVSLYNLEASCLPLSSHHQWNKLFTLLTVTGY